MNKFSFNVTISDFELVKRFDALSNELDIPMDKIVEIAIDRLLDDFSEIIHLWTCRKSVVQRVYSKPKKGDIF